MYADFVRWMKLVTLFLILMAFPAFLIILSKTHGDLVPGLLIGIAMYFVRFNRRKTARCESDSEGDVNDGQNGNRCSGQL